MMKIRLQRFVRASQWYLRPPLFYFIRRSQSHWSHGYIGRWSPVVVQPESSPAREARRTQTGVSKAPKIPEPSGSRAGSGEFALLEWGVGGCGVGNSRRA